MAHPIVYGPALSTYVWSARLAPPENRVTHELVEVPFRAQREAPGGATPALAGQSTKR